LSSGWDRRPRWRRTPLRFLIGALALAVAFGIGLALGESLHDNPSPGRTNTSVRTLKPLAVPPAPETVTVTVQG
jgi:hypothetical protein